MSDEIRQVHIGDILTTIHDRLVSPRGFGGWHEFIEYMAGEPVWTHQLSRVANECAPDLRRQFPDLAGVVIPEDLSGEEAVRAWLADCARNLGETRAVEPLGHTDHTSIDPISEWKMMRPDAPIIAVSTKPSPPNLD